MFSFVILWGFILGIALFVYLAFPLFTKQHAFEEIDPTEARMQTLFLEREQSYAALAELDEDYETGKLSEADYKELRTALLQETAQVIRKLEAEAKADVEDEIERYKRQRQG